MKKVQILLAALAGVALASCTSDSLVGVEETQQFDQQTPIVFGSFKAATTRADITGAQAAELLNNQFVVSGYKGQNSVWDDATSSIVFDNYVVAYEPNTANTTESNSSNWEYVGKGRIKPAIDNGITNQTIKYWDYSQPQYDFIAWSTGAKTAVFEGTPTAGEVLVSSITYKTATGATGIAYTFEGTADDLTDCYVADLVTVKKNNYGDDPVTIKFRNLGTKVRIGIYETVPGYSVKDVQFYSAAASDDANTTPKIFTTVANDIYTEGKYEVYYPTVNDETDADNNQAHIRFTGSGTQSTVVDFGNLNYTIAEDGEKTPGSVFLGRTSNTASFAGNIEGNYYTLYLPNETGTNLNLRVNYTLESIDGSGEVINVKGATAQVPAIYTTWKPGFAYTYLFKISDKTNGHTGVYDPTQPDDITVNSDPAGLYPITFDAVVVNAEEDGNQETITTVSAPSITTYQKGSNVVNNNEYQATTGDIFVTVNDGETETTPDLANGKLQTLTGKAALYTITDGKTEAEVVDALSYQDDDAVAGTIKGRSGLVLYEAPFTLVDKVEFGPDGNVIAVATDQALRFTPDAATTYAFVYTKKAATTTTDKYEAVTTTVGDAVYGLYRNALVAATAGDVQKNVKYFANDDASTGMITAFLGQGVSNLYLDNAGTIASGYAVTGTPYFYTVDGGMTYKEAHQVAYGTFATATLYTTTDGITFTAKSETEPVDGTAYYFLESDGVTYTYCVIYPQQTTGLYVIDEANYVACGTADVAVSGITYFDKYTKNDGVYYTKVIKVE